MKISLILPFIVGLALLSLGACHTSAELEGDGYRVRSEGGLPGGYRNTPRHCPPGHAKKGWC